MAWWPIAGRPTWFHRRYRPRQSAEQPSGSVARGQAPLPALDDLGDRRGHGFGDPPRGEVGAQLAQVGVVVDVLVGVVVGVVVGVLVGVVVGVLVGVYVNVEVLVGVAV